MSASIASQVTGATSVAKNFVFNVAQKGFGAGTNDLYDKARPSYPPEALKDLYAATSEGNDTPNTLNVLELGSGTGIFTRALLADPQFGSALKELKAVEPSEGMRTTFSQKVNDTRVSTYEGTFLETGVPDGWADLIVVAQAFHWCPDYSAAMTEFSRALKPKGVAAFIWNLEDRQSAKWVADLRDAYEVHEEGTPQYRLGLWRETFGTSGYTSNFAPQHEQSYKRIVPTTQDAVLDRVLSKSYISQLSDEPRQGVIDRVKEILKQGNGRTWIDESNGIFEYPYSTDLVLMKKLH